MQAGMIGFITLQQSAPSQMTLICTILICTIFSNLQKNAISSVMPGAFEELGQLTEL
jgi:hypothetical protein